MMKIFHQKAFLGKTLLQHLRNLSLSLEYVNVYKKKFLFVWYSLLRKWGLWCVDSMYEYFLRISYEHMSRGSFITLWFVVYNFLNSAVSSLVVVSKQLIHKLTSGLLQICNTTNPTRKDLDNTKMKRFFESRLTHVLK